MIPVSLSPLIARLDLPADCTGEELILGWRSINPDGTSRNGYRWPDPGNWTPKENADRADVACSHGLHVARTWAGASSAGSIRAALLVAYRPGDVAHVDAHKVRVDQALVLARFDPVAPIRAGWMAGANLRGADLRDADLWDADLRGADLRDANLRDADLEGAALAGADLRYANLAGANLRGANLRDANLTDANLPDANLRGANLGGANLGGANLGAANLRAADLWDASANRLTVWPDGFDPATKGVIVR